MQVKELLQQWMNQRLDLDLVQRVDTSFTKEHPLLEQLSPGALAAQLLEEDAEHQLDHLIALNKTNNWAAMKPHAQALLEKEGLTFDENSVAFSKLCIALLYASAELQEIRYSRSNGNFDQIDLLSTVPFLDEKFSRGTDALDATESSDTPPTASRLILRRLTEEFLREFERTEKPSEKYFLTYRAAMKLLTEAIGPETDIRSIKPDMLGEFRELALRLPRNHTKIAGSHSLRELVEKAESDGLSTRNPRTVRQKYIAPMKRFFAYARQRGLIEEDPSTNIDVRTSGRDRERTRNPFTLKDLQRIFNSPLYRGCKSSSRLHAPGSYKVRDHRYWIPLVLMFSGARLNEICLLQRRDVRKENDVWIIDINIDAEGKSVKTDAAIRMVPIHNELLKLGFLTYLENMHLSASESVWPKIGTGSSTYLSANVSKQLLYALNKILGTEYRKSKGLVLHSFRHTFIDAARNSGVPEDVRFALDGHSRRTIETAYGKGYSLEFLRSEMNKITYDGLDLSHLYP